MKRRGLSAALMVGVYAALCGVSSLAASGTRSDLDLFFWPAAQVAAHGHPLLVYSVPGLGPDRVDSGPVAILLLAPVALLADAAGWAADVATRTAVVDAVFALFAVGFTRLAVRTIERVRGAMQWRLAAACAFLATPPLWVAVAGFGHVDVPVELLLVLAGVVVYRRERHLLTGVALGLAVLTRSTAVLYVIPFAAVALSRERRHAVIIVVAAAASATVGLAPFLIADGPAVMRSLVTSRGALPVGGGSLWVTAYQAPWAALVERGDVLAIVLVTVLLVGFVAWRRPAAVRTPAGLLALLTVAAVTFPMLAKTVYPYYLLEPCVFATAWWLARPGTAWTRRLVVPVLLTVDVFMTEASVSLPFTGWGLAEGIASSVLLAVVIAVVVGDLFRSPDTYATPVAMHTMAVATTATPAPATSHA